MAIKDYSSTAASNTAISGIGIAGTNIVSNFDNALRQLLADIANWTDSDTVASATTTDLGSVEGMYVTVSGTSTITGFGTLKAGMVKFVYFSGAGQITYNATSMILPGAANITRAAGDTMALVSEGSGNWRCLSFQRGNGSSDPSLLMTTRGDLIRRGATAPERFAASSANQIVRYDGTDTVFGDQIRRDTAVALSGATGIGTITVPSGTRRITIVFSEVSLSGTDNILVRLGSGSLDSTGYVSTASTIANGSTGVDSATNGFVIRVASAASIVSGSMTIYNISGNDWISSFVGKNGTTSVAVAGGSKSLSGTIDRLTLVRSGTDTFDGGTVNVMFE